MKKDLQQWMIERPEQFECAKKIANLVRSTDRDVICCAPVKSGKRQIAQIISSICTENSVHCIITSLDRLDTKNQIEENKIYGLQTFIITDSSDRRDFNSYIEKNLKLGKKIFIHHDESDYGTDTSQCFAKFFYNDIKKINQKYGKQIYMIHYSATNEEILFSQTANNCEKVEFIPSSFYKGAEYILDNLNPKEAQSVFNFDDEIIKPTEQLIELLDTWTTDEKYNKKPYFSIRISGMKGKGKTRISDISRLKKADEEGLFEELKVQYNVEFRFIDNNNPYNWEIEERDPKRRFETYGIRTILFPCQTATRATELHFLNKIAGFHDFRSEIKNKEDELLVKSSYSAMAQAQIRPAHYSEKGEEFMWYGHIPVLELAAKRISYEDYKLNISSRTARTISFESLSSDKSCWDITTQEIENSWEIPQITEAFFKCREKHNSNQNILEEKFNKEKSQAIGTSVRKLNGKWKALKIGQHSGPNQNYIKVPLEEIKNNITNGLDKKSNTLTRWYMSDNEEGKPIIVMVRHNGTELLNPLITIEYKTRSGKNGSAFQEMMLNE